MDLPAPLDLLPPLLEGLRVTLRLTLGGALVGVVAALLAGFGQLSKHAPLRWLSRGYVELFRGTSVLVQLFWLYFALPRFGLHISALSAGIFALGLNAGSYGAEVVRGAVLGVPRGQRDAATALGFSPWQIRWRIVFPQAARAMLPPAGNLVIELLKSSALASMITLSELTFQGQILRASTLRTVEIFGLVLLLYFAVAQLVSYGVRRLERSLEPGKAA
ncbi:MAG TPA: ectoine/hydroxyectoine ABC transporter permease subunit EhuC [Polyangiaceae bacterium]|nr:ectoine/hydroxyectoine ABC transporter permease subunit EhuC [Polyangiaceae bacterium]